jgi:hypothetical protein
MSGSFHFGAGYIGAADDAVPDIELDTGAAYRQRGRQRHWPAAMSCDVLQRGVADVEIDHELAAGFGVGEVFERALDDGVSRADAASLQQVPRPDVAVFRAGL